MKLTSNGIGWLIAGALVCCSITKSDGVAGAAGTLGIGFTLIAIYLMKQRFEPVGKVLFIGGGLFLSFCLEETLRVLGGFASGLSILGDDLSTILIGLIIAAGLFFMFYKRNKNELQEAAGGFDYDDPAVSDGGFEYPFQEEVFREETVTVSSDNGASADDVDDIIDIEITDDE